MLSHIQSFQLEVKRAIEWTYFYFDFHSICREYIFNKNTSLDMNKSKVKEEGTIRIYS